jgi:hypothetical protein
MTLNTGLLIWSFITLPGENKIAGQDSNASAFIADTNLVVGRLS